MKDYGEVLKEEGKADGKLAVGPILARDANYIEKDSPKNMESQSDANTPMEDVEPEGRMERLQVEKTKDGSGSKVNGGKKKNGKKSRLFQCTGYPDCNMSFTRSEHLARHKRKHTGERPFQCPHCSKHFSRLDNLRQHNQTIHSQESLFRCRHRRGTSGASYSKGYNSSNALHILQPNNSPGNVDFNYYVGKDISPHTPVNPIFGPGGNGSNLLSPPYSNPLHNYHAPQPLGRQVEYLTSQSTNISINESSGSNYVLSAIKSEIPQFKPKRRPTPLALSHSTMHEDNSNHNSSRLQTLHSAPICSSVRLGPTIFPYTALSSASTPLSPLFHQKFHTGADLSPRSPIFAHSPMKHSDSYGRLSKAEVGTSANTLPSIQLLPIPTHYAPLDNNMLNKNESFNDDSHSHQAPVNTENQSSDTLDQHTPKEKETLRYKSSKPTISNLLSPTDD